MDKKTGWMNIRFNAPKASKLLISFVVALVLVFITFYIKALVESALMPKDVINALNNFDGTGAAIGVLFTDLTLAFFSFLLFTAILLWNKIYKYLLIALVMLLIIFSYKVIYRSLIEQTALNDIQLAQHQAQQAKNIANTNLTIEQQQALFIPEIKSNYTYGNNVTEPIDLIASAPVRLDLADIPNLIGSYAVQYNNGSAQPFKYGDGITVNLYTSPDIAATESSSYYKTQLPKINLYGSEVYSYGDEEFKWSSAEYMVAIPLGVDQKYDPTHPNAIMYSELIKEYLKKYPSSIK
jgi:hypothetical protein